MKRVDYDALDAGRRRYLPTEHIRALFESAGFVQVQTTIAQHMPDQPRCSAD
jgi:hypothetical protein